MTTKNHATRHLMAVALATAMGSVNAQTAPPNFPDAQASDPVTLGWTAGFPPPPRSPIRADLSSP